ncbi:hypothetical protein A6R68_05229 [Neotoma lepida]|uniref:DH domain-containing protein n=1 Tax=Neotoma lepida TaxID=56216 RepID=A0A1A6GJ44_NEOLE|nr:hypothetical protein A6R68_05229 [Neotoma lepida]
MLGIVVESHPPSLPIPSFCPEVLQQIYSPITHKEKQHCAIYDIKGQEAIHELSQGKQGLVKDLKLARKAYHDPTLKLSSSQRRNPHIRLVKYPFLLKGVLKHTPRDHPDVQFLEEAVLIMQRVLSDKNLKKGEPECQYYINKLEYLDEKCPGLERGPRITASQVLQCYREQSKSAHKVHTFLFQDILVLTRLVRRNEPHSYWVCLQTIPVQELVLVNLQGVVGNSDKAKNIFIEFTSKTPLQASSTHCEPMTCSTSSNGSCILTAISPFPASSQHPRALGLRISYNTPYGPQLKIQLKFCFLHEMSYNFPHGSCCLSVLLGMTFDMLESEKYPIQPLVAEEKSYPKTQN